MCQIQMTVQLEYRVGQQWADYALMSNGQPVAVIEAKRLGRGLEDDEIMQVLNYANRDGIDYVIMGIGRCTDLQAGCIGRAMLMRFCPNSRLIKMPCTLAMSRMP